jgi:hypothetical protein
MTTPIKDGLEDFKRIAGTTTPVIASAAGVTTPDFVCPYKGKADLYLINQFWGKPASAPIKVIPPLNLANSKLFKRRAEKAAADVPS